MPGSGHPVLSRGHESIYRTSTPAFGVLCQRASLLRTQEGLWLESRLPPCLPSSWAAWRCHDLCSMPLEVRGCRAGADRMWGMCEMWAVNGRRCFSSVCVNCTGCGCDPPAQLPGPYPLPTQSRAALPAGVRGCYCLSHGEQLSGHSGAVSVLDSHSCSPGASSASAGRNCPPIRRGHAAWERGTGLGSV